MSVPAIVFRENFVGAPQALFKHLTTTVTWDERMRARKTASFGVAYNYSQMSYPEAPIPTALDAIAENIEASLGYLPNNCLLNFYPDGEASMGFHSDSSEELAPGSGVSIVSLGAARPIVFRLKANRSIEHTLTLTGGSLLHMPNAIQDEWLHAIPRCPSAGPRISVTFRKIVK